MKKKKTAFIILTFIIVAAAVAAAAAILLLGDKEGGDITDPKEREGVILRGDAYISDASAQLPAELSKVTIEASEGGNIIPVTASFKIKTAGKTDVDTLAKYLSVSPAVPFSVSDAVSGGESGDGSGDGSEFTLTPQTELRSGEVYRFMLGSSENPVYSFAFQTERSMLVRSTLPGDHAMNVPVNTGIEITFTDTVKEGKLSEYIEISPAVKGKLEIYPDGRTAVLIPDRELDKNTVYTVTVKEGVEGLSGKRLEAAASFSFRTEAVGSDEPVRISTTSNELIFSPDEYPTVIYGVYIENTNKIKSELDVSASLYRYETAQAASDALRRYEDEKEGADGEYKFDTDALELVYTGLITPQSESVKSHSRYFSLPQLDAGIYLLEYEIGIKYGFETYKRSMQCMIVITSLRVHTESYNKETLYFVTDDTGKTVSDAEIRVESFYRESYWSANAGKSGAAAVNTGRTGADGVCVLEASPDANAAYVTVSHSGKETLLTVCLDPERDRGGFASYIFSDRRVYFSEDTVNYSGVISPYGGKALPSRLYVYVGTVPYGELEVGGDGSFSGSLSIESYGGRGCNIAFYDAERDLSGDDGANLVCSHFVSVTQEDKPVYRASLTFDRLFYRFGETITVKLTASFYDGTPASGLRFLITSGTPSELYGEVVTGADGSASVSVKTTPFTRAYSTRPISLYFNAELIGYETSSLLVGAGVVYFHSDVQLKTERDRDASYVYLYKTDTSGIRSEEDLKYPDFPDNTCGEAAEGEANISLIKTVYKKTETSYYDPITKTTKRSYHYTSEETTVWQRSESFKDGKIRLMHIEVGEGENVSYHYKVVYYDKDNECSYKSVLWAVKDRGESEYGNSFWEPMSIAFESDSNAEDADGADTSVYGIGDRITAVCRSSGANVTLPVLYTVYDSDGLASYYVANTDTDRIKSGTKSGYTFEMTDEMVLSAHVYATSYDEDAGMRSAAREIRYDYSESELTLSITPDAEEYRPGDTARVSVLLLDGDGKPVSGRVTVAIVDEACFALGEQTLSPLMEYFCASYYAGYLYYSDYYFTGSYYGMTPVLDGRFSVFNDIYEGAVYYKSYGDGLVENDSVPSEPMAGDEATGAENSGEGVYIRKYFADNLVFTVLTSDESGRAELVFTVPDNITSWRISAVATAGTGSGVDSGSMLGCAVTGTICTQPYFINVSASDIYIVGDDVAVSVRSAGTAVRGDETASCRAVLYGDGGSIGEWELEAASDEFMWFNFGKLEAGEYRIVFESALGGYTDGVETVIEVRESANIVPVRREMKISELGGIRALQYPVTLSFYGSEGMKFSRVYNMICSGYVPSRNDSRAAYYAALKAAEAAYGFDLSVELRELKESLSSGAGYIPLLEYGTRDLTLSAEILAAAPDSISNVHRGEIVSLLLSYIEGGTYTDETEFCSALLGLAAAGEPVLDRLNYALGGYLSYPAEAQLYLMAAFAHIGDFTTASELYTAFISEHGKRGTSELYIDGKDVEESLSLTARALLTASRVSRTDAYSMINYIGSHPSKSEYYGLYLASYLRFYMPTEIKTSTLCYRLGGELAEIELAAGRVYTVSLTKSGFESFSIEAGTSEDIMLCAAYGGSPDEAKLGGAPAEAYETDEKFTVRREISPYDSEAGLYLVTLHYSGSSQRRYSSYSISDCIPSGARYVTSISGGYSGSVTGDRNIGAYIESRGGQQLEGRIYIYPKYDPEKWYVSDSVYTFEGALSYIIRGAVKGEFIAEAPLMRDLMSGAYAEGERMRLLITDGDWITETIKKR